MACFIVPLTEGIILTGAALLKKRCTEKTVREGTAETISDFSLKASFKENFGNLQKMLFGGSFLLAIEHIYHGEVIFVPPFLTAMKNPEDIPEMLHEMATVGLGMAVITTAAWSLLCLVSFLHHKKSNYSLGEKKCAF